MWSRLFDVGGRKIKDVQVGDRLFAKEHLADRTFYNKMDKNNEKEKAYKRHYYICTTVYPHLILARDIEDGREITMNLGDLVILGFEKEVP